MTPEELVDTVLFGANRTQHLHMREAMIDVVRAAYAVAYEDAAQMSDEWGQGDYDASISALDFEKKYGEQIDLSAYIRARGVARSTQEISPNSPDQSA